MKNKKTIQKTTSKRKKSTVRKLIHPKNILIPSAIGVILVFYIIYKNWDQSIFENITWSEYTLLFLFIALIMVIIRDLGYMLRLRILTKNEIGWKRAFEIIMLWEFSSAITPSVVGGSGVAIFILNKEGLTIGRSTAVVMITAFLDELFYFIMVPTVLFFVGTEVLFPIEFKKNIFGLSFNAKDMFWIGYFFIFVLISIIGFGIFINPKKFKNILFKIFCLSFLKKWRKIAIVTGNDIITTSKELKNQSFKFWIKTILTTFLSWTSRFWVTNFLLLSVALNFFNINEHLIIYARQLVMWVIMLISPTPGGAGIAEFVFGQFLKEFTPVGFAIALSVIWRLFTYYPYLLIGSLLLPEWIQRVYLKRKFIKFKKT